MTDPIADMLTRIRNAQAVRKPYVLVPFSKLKERLSQIFAAEGFVRGVETISIGVKKDLKISLKYDQNTSVIRGLKRVSKPGRRVYVSVRDLPVVLNGLGIAVLSTSHGLMTNKEARQRRLGGEVLCEIY